MRGVVALELRDGVGRVTADAISTADVALVQDKAEHQQNGHACNADNRRQFELELVRSYPEHQRRHNHVAGGVRCDQ